MSYLEKSFLKVIILIFIVSLSFAFAQISDTTQMDSSAQKTTKIDSTIFFNNDSLKLQFAYPIDKKIPNNIVPVPKSPNNPWETDYRGSSYYTPKLVQDKMNQIMNRPRSDSFMPVLAMAYFAASLAAKQLQIDKIFELTAEDYIIPEGEWSILEALWYKSPQRIDQLYLDMDLKENNTADQLKKQLGTLADNNLIKTRDAGNNIVLFYPAQDRETVKKLIDRGLRQSVQNDSLIIKIEKIFNRLQDVPVKHQPK